MAEAKRKRRRCPKDVRSRLHVAAQDWLSYPDTQFSPPGFLQAAAKDAGVTPRRLRAFQHEQGNPRVREAVLDQVEHASRGQLCSYWWKGG